MTGLREGVLSEPTYLEHLSTCIWGLADHLLRKGYNAFDNDPWVVRLVDFVKEVLAQNRVRIIGVCYGHQIVGRALGAKVARSEGGAWEVSVSQVKLTEKGKRLFGGRDTLVRTIFS